MSRPPLHVADPLSRFSDRAADYASARPSYPPEAIDAVLSGLGDPAALDALDVGAGTGISARLLADRGPRVTAVEPNVAMQNAAEPHPRVRWHTAPAENTGLPGASADLVLCAQSFHWFDAPRALREFHRLLRPGGRLALLWNDRDRDDPFTRSYCEVIDAHSTLREASSRDLAANALDGVPGFGPPRAMTFTNTQTCDLPGLIARARSASYVPKSGPAAEAVAHALNRLHASSADARGLVTLRYVTRLFAAEKI